MSCEFGDCSQATSGPILGLAVLVALVTGLSLAYSQTRWFFVPRNSRIRSNGKQDGEDEDEGLFPHPEGGD